MKLLGKVYYPYPAINTDVSLCEKQKREEIMIYFYDSLVAQTVEIIKSAYDCADVLNDLNRIEQAKERTYNGDCLTGEVLDQELREKYPCIDKLLQGANSFPSVSRQSERVYSNSERITMALDQDKYGILCDTAIKKGLIHSIKEFIKSVD